MSFSFDFLDNFDLNKSFNGVVVNFVLGIGVVFVGKYKLINFDENEIKIKVNNGILNFCGNGLKIKSIAKGELIITGKVCEIKCDYDE